MKTLTIIIALFTGLSIYGQDNSWTSVRVDLPLDETFKAGTRVVFVINYDTHTVVDYVNESDIPVRIIHNVSENGVALPEERIGPVSVRTKELDPGETLKITYNWQKGQEVTLEIYNGKVHIEARPEEKRF